MMSTLQPYVKAKWCDTAYFLAQDINMESKRDERLIHCYTFSSDGIRACDVLPRGLCCKGLVSNLFSTCSVYA